MPTLADIRARLRRMLEDTDPVAPLWSDTELNEWLAVATREYGARFPREATATIAAGNAFAATQGTLGATSQGSLVITLTIDPLVQISALNDIALGTYTGGGKSKGIYRFEFDAKTGTPTEPKLAAETTNPSFLAIAPDGRFLYAVGEYAAGKKKVGAVSAFSLDPKTGDLKLINQQSSGGAGPCHVVIDKQGRNVLAANYGSGSACACG